MAEAPNAKALGEYAERQERAAAAMREFAGAHDLSYTEEGSLPRFTPLLSGKDDPRATDLVSGELPGGITGLISAYSFRLASPGEDEAPRREITVAMTRVPESVGFIPVVTAHDAGTRGFGELVAGAGGLIPAYARIELESIKFNATYRIGVLKSQDQVKVRRLFSPTFIDWMAEHAADGSYFDLMFGVLCVATNEPLTDTESLTRLCAFTAQVAERVRSEALEGEDLGGEVIPPAGAVVKAERKRDEWVERVRFSEPPPGVTEAARPYRRLIRRRPFVWIGAFVFAAFMAFIIGGIVGGLSITFLKGRALYVFGGVFAIVFLYVFVWMVRTVIRAESEAFGLVAFMRGYGKTHELSWEEAWHFQTAHPRTPLPGVVSVALNGAIPGGGREGTVLIWGDPAGRRSRQSVAAAVLTRIPNAHCAALELTPRGRSDAARSLGGFLIEGAKGVHESDHDRAAREKSEQLSKDLIGGDGSLGAKLDGEDLVLYTAQGPLTEIDATLLDELCRRAGEVADRVESLVTAPA